VKLGAVQFGLLKLGFSTSQGNLGFPVGTKLGVSNKLGCNRGTSSSEDLEIKYFVDVFEDENDLRWWGM
jgi:hypothetical protein